MSTCSAIGVTVAIPVIGPDGADSRPRVSMSLSIASPATSQSDRTLSIKLSQAGRSTSGIASAVADACNRSRCSARCSMRWLPPASVITRVASKQPSPRVKPRSSEVNTGSLASTIPRPMTATARFATPGSL